VPPFTASPRARVLSNFTFMYRIEDCATPADFVQLNGNAHSLKFLYNYELFFELVLLLKSDTF
jgi:hypothetical protein